MPAEDVSVDVVLDDRQNEHAVDGDRYARLLDESLRARGISAPAEVGLAFIDTDEMAELNIHHMGGTGPTDVLAFPIDGSGQVPEGQPALLGDIVMCPAVAAKAPQPLEDELALLVVHGALHLLGHDHAEPDETAIMRGLESELLTSYWTPQ